MSDEEAASPVDFVRAIVEEDIRNGKNGGAVVTRFPPEPNGYLHIGHAKAICVDFGIAKEYGGRCHLRFDDTNPVKEAVEYVDSIQEDVKWLGWDWGEHLYWASDYFDKMHECAIELIKKGLAYVDDLSVEEIREMRGNLTEPGTDSPHRTRSIEENLDLFERMTKGEFPGGAKVLRAKIDMASPNMNLRDPLMYRILHAEHHNTGDKWCVYPIYDWAHGLEDSIEGVTHSICTLEFENHRPLYDWFLDQLPEMHHPQQIEFARLNLTYTIMSKRKLLRLVEENHVDGWDDPRMPTICGLRRRGFTAEAIREFCRTIGVTKFNSLTDIALLEHCLRSDLNKRAARYMGVMDPIKVVIETYPEGEVDELEAVNNPEDESMGKRIVPFTREIYIERDDFMEEPPKKFFRLAPGREVRLRYAYLITCTDVVKDADGKVVELRCTHDPESRGGNAPDGRKVKGTIHWVSAQRALDAEVRLYDRLFTVENPESDKEKDFTEFLNPDSLTTIHAKVEPALAGIAPETTFQFERNGYFVADRYDCVDSKLVFNRSVPLRDSWAKLRKKTEAPKKRTKPQPSKSDNKAAVNVAELVDIAQFGKVDLRTAKILEAERVEGADKLLKLQIQVGEQPRQIVAGIAKWYAPEDLVGKNIVIVANLKPAKIFGVESNGMLLAARAGKKKLTILTTDDAGFASGASVG